ncbi:hypothetical protein QT970_14400 [Microcoleus sp. herbarium8]|uniref:hypothetical protein n=1 Tax=Microcoleus sp. herbarium8 TaxID=3055436 RepID=UPI002FD1D8FE
MLSRSFILHKSNSTDNLLQKSRELEARNLRIFPISRPVRATFYIVSGCIGIIKSSQQLTLNHSVFRPARQQSTVNSQQLTVNSQQSTIPEKCNRN